MGALTKWLFAYREKLTLSKKAGKRSARSIFNARLRYRVLLPFTLALIVIIFTIGQLSANLITSKMAELAREKAAKVLEDTLHEFEEYQVETRLFTEMTAITPGLVEAIESPDFVTLWRLLTPARERFRFHNLMVVDSHKNPLLVRGPLPPREPAIALLIIQGLNGTTSSALVETLFGVEVFAGAPIKKGDRVVGVLITSMDTSKQLIRQVKERNRVEVTISRERRIIISTMPPEMIPRGASYVSNNRQITGSAMTLSVMVSTDDIERTKSTLTAGINWITIVGLLIVLIIGLLLANSISRPLQKIAEVTRLYTEGQFDHRVDVTGSQEIRQLSDAINQMASTVGGRLEDAQRQANIDGLTGLYNHLYFYDRLAAEIQRADRFNSSFGIIFCDLDDFKLYNDQNGHTFGDAALRKIAEIIKASIREVDIAARYGGEEFAIILPEATSGDSMVVANRLMKAVAKHTFETKLGIPCSLTVSVGVVTYPEHGSSAVELVERVDDAMYQAKRLGKNRVQLYNARIRKAQPHNLGSNEPANSRFLNYVKSLAAIVDARDRYCCSHSQTVARLARLIGERMSLSQEQLQDLTIAGLLHDVGKIAISDTILKKHAALTLEERDLINQHPVMGSNILRPVTASIDIVRSVLHHHEHFDGTGYPDGLSGREIPLGARIIAIADAYHAMISDRPYRAALPSSRALAELRANAGSQFDPEVVSVFIKVVESGEIRDLEDAASGSA